MFSEVGRSRRFDWYPQIQNPIGISAISRSRSESGIRTRDEPLTTLLSYDIQVCASRVRNPKREKVRALLQGRSEIDSGSIRDRSRVDPRSIQGRSEIDPGSIRSRFRVDPRSIQGRSEIDPGSIRDRSRVDPRSIQGRSEVDPGSIRSRSGVDPRSIQGRSEIDPGSIRSRSI